MSVHKRMIEVLADVCAIEKNQENAGQGFKFRGIDDVYNALHPLFAKHGILWAPRVVSSEYVERRTKSGGGLTHCRLSVIYDVSAADGTAMTVGPVMGEAMDSGDKASSKALSIAFKTAVFQTFVIPTQGDNDPDSVSYERVSYDRETPAEKPVERQYTMKDYEDAGKPTPGAAHYVPPEETKSPKNETTPYDERKGSDGKPHIGTTVSETLKTVVGGDKARAVKILTTLFGKSSTQQCTTRELDVLALFLRAYPNCGKSGTATVSYFKEGMGFSEFPDLTNAQIKKANDMIDAGGALPDNKVKVDGQRVTTEAPPPF